MRLYQKYIDCNICIQLHLHYNTHIVNCHCHIDSSRIYCDLPQFENKETNQKKRVNILESHMVTIVNIFDPKIRNPC